MKFRPLQDRVLIRRIEEEEKTAALKSPDIGEHDDGSGKSKAAHDSHKSLAFNLQQPRNPQREAVHLACQSMPRRRFHRHRRLTAARESHPATYLKPSRLCDRPRQG